MKIAIVGGENTPEIYSILDKKMNELIEEKQIFLFYVVCGGQVTAGQRPVSLGEVWAKNNGAPVLWLNEPTPARLFKEVDYIVFIFDGRPHIKRLMMQYKMTGKHGSVINLERN